MPRKPSSKAGLPATFVEAEELEVLIEVSGWCARHWMFLTSRASHEEFEIFFFEQLQNAKGSLTAADIVDIARRGHPPADRALRHFIQVCSEDRCLDAMPTSVLDYLMRDVATRPPLPEYPSTAPQTANHFARDVAICWWIPLVQERYPKLPRLYSSGKRRSAVALVGAAFGLSERQTLRIYQARAAMAEQLVRFFHGYTNTSPNTAVSFVS